MNYFGLTGGIGCGKTTLSSWLMKEGFEIIDTDRIAQELLQPGRENWKKVVDEFGKEILNNDNTINRRLLGQLVFQNPKLLETLNRLTHPSIRQQWKIKVIEAKKSDPRKRIIVVIPLLFEEKLEKEFDKVLCVGCSPSVQFKRLLDRGLISREIRMRIESQWPLEKKMENSDFVFWNDGSIHLLHDQARMFLDQLRSYNAGCS
ncbi:dephospho-CoA kinase [Candidatus Methylacidiphilum fumarolicum]|uniref:Dephospho-CoA kinase n=2 Tax=Candidatus Methylacidiphilum fumarolicum TaxID=591154 RepID=I0JZY8_METFB|nr:dephospho-CoA kinase [Candidatus Methylacidiphilum fumarolicum]MBW6415168.1 dephospho-CoA kinase [Candidatus Methylacidiphilum fumarolicum]TFE65955.1 dephospho-CoA kinase [Candidatus Methylacidiphilum fumarolicum]TFE72688.1 dephospho-CoA kinase [Candidatus Methylacidiphilum fumarolicum]TFE73153.1 dephospho-CoA kinase [Candidatus Methylacidiphilum fumarolicum]TFE77555.1 dephospho-CoA kinase [Candidatus Methylacidiphilum fumarolicum]